MPPQKPKFFLLPGEDLTLSSMSNLYAKLTGKKPDEREIQEVQKSVAREAPRSATPIQDACSARTLSAIPIRRPYIDWILEGSKTWEIRSKRTKKIGPVALVQSGSGSVVGVARLTDVVELTASIAIANARKIHVSRAEAGTLEGLYAWVLDDIVRLNRPVRYHHRPGAVTWVTLDQETTKDVEDEAKQSRRRTS